MHSAPVFGEDHLIILANDASHGPNQADIGEQQSTKAEEKVVLPFCSRNMDGRNRTYDIIRH